MDLQPLGDRLIVEVLDEEAITASGIVLPDTAQEKPQRGSVLVVGPGPRDEDGEYIKMDVEEGDEIIFSKYARHRDQDRRRRRPDPARIGCAREGRNHRWQGQAQARRRRRLARFAQEEEEIWLTKS